MNALCQFVGSPRGARFLATAILVYVFGRTLLLMVGLWEFETDDAYISLRYARHLAVGHGITWNPGEPPVEGYSNFLFVILGALALKVGAHPIIVLKLISSGALLVTCLLLYRISRHWLGPVAATLPPLFLTAYEGSMLWTVSGLESAVYQLLVVAAVAAFFRALPSEERPEGDPAPVSHRHLSAAGMLAFLASLARPEGPIVAGVLILGILACRRRLRSRASLRALAVLGLSFGLPFAIYSAWRLSHFHRLLPNSVQCKIYNAGDPWSLLREFWRTAAPFLLLSLVYPLRRVGVRHLVLWTIPVIYLFALYGADPIVGYANRHFLTALALVMVSASVGLERLSRVMVPQWTRPVRECALALLVVVGTAWTADQAFTRLKPYVERYSRRMEARLALGRWIDARTTSADWLVIGDTGLVPYITRAKVLDAFCLNNAEMAGTSAKEWPGRFASTVFDRKPELIVVHSANPTSLQPRGEYGVFPELARRPELTAGYQLVVRFGARRDDFYYWVFARKGTKR